LARGEVFFIPSRRPGRCTGTATASPSEARSPVTLPDRRAKELQSDCCPTRAMGDILSVY